MLPKHTPLAARKELSRKLHSAKAKKRLALGVDAETLRWRAMHPISPMNDTPRNLMIGATYEIKCEHRNGFVGRAVFVEKNPVGYLDDTYRFRLINDPDGYAEGVFDLNEIGALVAYPESPEMKLRARVESASAIITELLARTAKTESPECDEAVAAAMAWLHDNK